MKRLPLLFSFLGLSLLLASCTQPSQDAESAVASISDAEIVTFPSGKESYHPTANIEDLTQATFAERMPEEENIHLEFDLANNRVTKRVHGEQTTSMILDDVEIKTYMDVYEVSSPDKTVTFYKVGPRIIEDEDGVQYVRVN